MPTDPIRHSPIVDADVVDRLAVALDQFASTLSPREQAILHAIVDQALPPHERMRRRAADDLLDDAERRILDRLKDAHGPG